MVGRASRSIFALYLASAVFVTVQRGVFSPSNNFKVFRAAAVNLLAPRALYAAHPDQHFDFYKYSPTFALLFAPLAALPFAPALLIWSLLNSLLLWYAVRRLLPERQATLALALVYLEVLLRCSTPRATGSSRRSSCSRSSRSSRDASYGRRCSSASMRSSRSSPSVRSRWRWSIPAAGASRCAAWPWRWASRCCPCS